jgi:hypothetical protein
VNKYELRAEVTLIDRRGQIAIIDGEPFSFVETLYMPTNKDKYKTLLGDTNAKVSVGLSVKLSGAGYSSASISVNVSLSCDQTEDTVTRAKDFALEECAGFISAHGPSITQMLDALAGGG